MKHVLAINIFETVGLDDGVASPGFAYAFYPQVGTTSGPKHIIVAGDGSLDVWHLRPIPGVRFGYEPRQVAEPRGTTGELLLDDFDGDGIMDVLVPDNDNWDLRVITFSRDLPAADQDVHRSELNRGTLSEKWPPPPRVEG